MQKLESINAGSYMNGVLANILMYNLVQIEDGVTHSKFIRQTNGVLQGDPISPLLFNIITADIATIVTDLPQTTLIMYADDMVLGSPDKEQLQTALRRLQEWADKNKFEINETKTVQMVFRKGGRISPNDTLSLNETPLEIVNSFKYLGVTLQPTASSFRLHIQERAAASIKAMYDVKNLPLLSIDTAMTLFETKITPIITYGIEVVWEKLTRSDLARIEQIKSRYLKRVLGIGKNAKSRLTYELTRETFFLEDIRLRHLLASTGPYAELIEERRAKRTEIDPEFYGTGAMTDRTWTKENQPQRHIIIKLATHGFHHKMCKNKVFHEPCEACVCELCGKFCERYHILKCNRRTRSISEYSKD